MKIKTDKDITQLPRSVFNVKLNDIFVKYNNNYRRTNQIRLVHAKDNTYIDHTVKSNDEDPKCKVFLLKIPYRGHMILVILTVEILLECLTKKSCKKQIKQFRVCSSKTNQEKR